MRDGIILRAAFGKAAGFLYAVIVGLVANLVFAYVLPHGTRLEKAALTPHEAAAAAPLPPATTAGVAAAAAPAPTTTTVSAVSSAVLPGPGSGGLY